jgi:hypothetical protein
MRPDPEPHEIAAAVSGQGPVVKADARGPQFPDLLEMQRPMTRVDLESGVLRSARSRMSFGNAR